MPKKHPTRLDFKIALETIAEYILPSFPIQGRGDMVPLETADYLRQIAENALAGKKAED